MSLLFRRNVLNPVKMWRIVAHNDVHFVFPPQKQQYRHQYPTFTLDFSAQFRKITQQLFEFLSFFGSTVLNNVARTKVCPISSWTIPWRVYRRCAIFVYIIWLIFCIKFWFHDWQIKNNNSARFDNKFFMTGRDKFFD